MTAIRCHYEVLDIPRDADAATIKKSHRRKALKHHPDKVVGKTPEEQEQSASEFKLIQAAYECLSDPVERKWYDEHRDMILRGGVNSVGGAEGGDGSTFLFDVMPFHNAGCYNGYDVDEPDSFYAVYNEVFEQIFEGEREGYVSEGNIDVERMNNIHLSEVEFGDSTSNWKDILAFYNTWEGFTSCLSFAWADLYHLHDIKEAPSRQVRRLMDDDNKKKRKAAKKERIEEICALVRFVKKRDPRVKAKWEKTLREQAQKEAMAKKEAAQRKKDLAAAKDEWRAEQEQMMAEQEAADLSAGRVRLADLSDDDYDYGGGKRGRGKKKKKGKGKGGKKKAADDRELVLTAVTQNGNALQYASAELQGDPDIVLAAVKQDGQALQYASVELRGDREIVLAAVEQHGKALEYALDMLKNNREIVLAAVKSNGHALEYASEELKAQHEIVLAAVKQDGTVLNALDAGIDNENGQSFDDVDATIKDETTVDANKDVDYTSTDLGNPLEEEQSIAANSSEEGMICDEVNNMEIQSESSSEESEEEPDSWRCECCRKDFKSQKQFENHERSKKHKETLKKYKKKLEEEAERQALLDMMDEINDESDASDE